MSATLAVHYLTGTATDSLDDKAACGRRRGAMVSGQYTADHDAVTCRRCATLAPAPVEPQPTAVRGTRTWDANLADSHACEGACAQTKPAKAFPTTSRVGRRGVVCRSCRDAARGAA